MRTNQRGFRVFRGFRAFRGGALKTGNQSPWLAVLAAALLLPACGRPSDVDPNRRNEAPTGYVDTPRNGEVVGRMVDVSGWAADDRAVSVVRISVDGRPQASARVTIPRPDVSKSLPKYSTHGDVHGWRVSVDLGESAGPHTILAQAVDDEGAARDLNAVVVTVVSR